MPEAAAPPAPAGDWLDWERAFLIVDDDLHLLHHLVKVFVTQFASACAELRDAGALGDWPAVSRRAHQLAGAAGAIGAVGLDAAARAADRAARAAQLADGGAAPASTQHVTATHALQELVDCLDATLAGAATWLAGPPG